MRMGALLAALLLSACSSPTEPVTQVLYVLPQHWVGIEYTFANSGPLNSGVEDHRRAGWDCGESLLDFPVWLPQDPDFKTFALVVAHFYLCTAEPVER